MLKVFSRFHYLVFNVHRRLFPIRVCVSEASNKKPRYPLDIPFGQVKKTVGANAFQFVVTSTRLPLQRGGHCSSA
jgi:hypothetical protein